MTLQNMIDYCLKKKGAYLCFPFGANYAVVKVKATGEEKGRIFAQIFELKGKPVTTFNCAAEAGFFYRQKYPDKVVRGWHWPPVTQPYFNTVSFDGSVPDDEIYKMADESYEVVFAKLPKIKQKEINDL
jgi:predicted DNA-binding protein (MmcQ/YjbR family)